MGSGKRQRARMVITVERYPELSRKEDPGASLGVFRHLGVGFRLPAARPKGSILPSPPTASPPSGTAHRHARTPPIACSTPTTITIPPRTQTMPSSAKSGLVDHLTHRPDS
ncbi:hypothetical protein LT493_37635 [Streptomyces tricolor]|nr:hypothetical protein [Streptomyces tricolor]